LLSDNFYYYHRGEHTYTPLYADVYLDTQYLDSTMNPSLAYRVTDYLNGGGGQLPQTAPDGGKTASAKFIPGSVFNEIGSYDTIDNGSFAFLETSDKGKAWVSTYHFKDGKLTRGASHIINEDPSVTVNVSEDLVTYYKDGKLIKAQICSFTGGEIKLGKEIPLGTGEAATAK
jgi:hypothetical protein